MTLTEIECDHIWGSLFSILIIFLLLTLSLFFFLPLLLFTLKSIQFLVMTHQEPLFLTLENAFKNVAIKSLLVPEHQADLNCQKGRKK